MGNHSRYHSGCAAVWDYLTARVAGSGATLADQGDFDVLVVNGEGSMHRDRPSFLKKMHSLQEAVEGGKKAYLVNTTWQLNSSDFDPVLRRLNGIIVREILSRIDLQMRHGISPGIAPDLSFYRSLDAAQPDPRMMGRTLATDHFDPSAEAFVWSPLVVQRGFVSVDLKATTWSQLVASIATADVMITGRHHAVYACCKARLPFAAIRGNSHKIEGLLRWSGFPIPVFDRFDEAAASIEWVKSNRAMYTEFFDWLDQAASVDPLPVGVFD